MRQIACDQLASTQELPEVAAVQGQSAPPANDTIPVTASHEPVGVAPAALAVVDDYGKVPNGASEAHYVLAENGSEYIMKGPSFVPEQPTVAANEWIAVKLAALLSLPVLDHQILTMGGDLFFGSSWMQKPTFYPRIDEAKWKRCENRDRVHGIAVFDSWLINQDRHAANLIVRRIKRRADRFLLLLNDHSHLLVSPLGPEKIDRLMRRVDAPPDLFVSLPLIRENVVEPSEIHAVIDRIEGLSDADIRAVVESTPDQLLQASDQATYAEFLTQRRARLRGLMQAGSSIFPNLKGAL